MIINSDGCIESIFRCVECRQMSIVCPLFSLQFVRSTEMKFDVMELPYATSSSAAGPPLMTSHRATLVRRAALQLHEQTEDGIIEKKLM